MESTGGDGSSDVEEQVASTDGLVVAWMSQHEGDLVELARCSLLEVPMQFAKLRPDLRVLWPERLDLNGSQ